LESECCCLPRARTEALLIEKQGMATEVGRSPACIFIVELETADLSREGASKAFSKSVSSRCSELLSEAGATVFAHAERPSRSLSDSHRSVQEEMAGSGTEFCGTCWNQGDHSPISSALSTTWVWGAKTPSSRPLVPGPSYQLDSLELQFPSL
jgi:hypothetical protein